jgi:hypothetical protein
VSIREINIVTWNALYVWLEAEFRSTPAGHRFAPPVSRRCDPALTFH